jgi:hypothetical protein
MFMYIYMYVYIYVCMYVYIYIYTYRPLIDTVNETKQIKNETKNKQMKNKLTSSSGIILIQFLDIIRIGIQKIRLFRVLECVQMNSRGLLGLDNLTNLDRNDTINKDTNIISENNETIIDLFSGKNSDLKDNFLFHCSNSISSVEKNVKNKLIEKLLNDEYKYMTKFPDCVISIFISAQDGFELRNSQTSSENTKLISKNTKLVSGNTELLLKNTELESSIFNPISIKFSNPCLFKEYLFNVYLGSLLR